MATNNPIGSQAPEDFKFNVANIDRAMNSDAATFTSRAASDQPAREQFTWSEIQRRAVVEISAAEQAKIDAQAARDDAQAIAETLAAVKIYRTYALAVADLPNLQDGDNVEINQDETTDGLRTRYVVASGALSDKTILSTVVNATATPIVDTAAWEDVPVLESTPATIAAALNTVAQKLAKRTKWLYDAVASFDISVLVQKTSSTGVAILPEGDDAARPTTIPTDGGLIRANNKAGDYFLEIRNRVSSAWEALATRGWVDSITDALGLRVSTLETKYTGNRFTTELLWSGSVGSAQTITLSRELIEGEMFMLTYGVNTNTQPAIYFPSLGPTGTSGGALMWVAAAGANTTMEIIQPLTPGAGTQIKFIAFTGGFNVTSVRAIKGAA